MTTTDWKSALGLQGEIMDASAEETPLLLLRTFAALCGALLALWAVPAAAPLAYLGLAAYALRGSKEVVQALTLLVLLVLLNPGLARASGALSLRWLVLLAAFARVIWDSIIQRATTPRDVLAPLLLFTFVMLPLTLLTSIAPVISAFKLAVFAIGTGTVLTAFHRTAHLQAYWVSWFVTVFLFTTGASLPLYASPLGYLDDPESFQGILNHPQAYGPLAAPVTALLMGLYLLQGIRSPVVLLGIVLGWTAMLTSNARTALVAVLGGLLVTLLATALPGRRQPVLPRAPSFTGALLVLVALTTLAVLYGSELLDFATAFALKEDDQGVPAGSTEIRRGMIEEQFANFRASPFTGIGFGAPSNLEGFREVRTGFLGLPTGAPVEKSFMPSAVLEETGVVGAVFVLLLVLALIRPVYGWGRPPVLWMFMACLLVNVGEMIFFSLGGIGLYFWLLIGLSYNLSAAPDG